MRRAILVGVMIVAGVVPAVAGVVCLAWAMIAPLFGLVFGADPEPGGNMHGRSRASSTATRSRLTRARTYRRNWRRCRCVSAASETGLDVPLGDGVLLGVLAHHRRIVAEVSSDFGGIDATGNGLGASLALGLGNGVYVDGRVSAMRFPWRRGVA